jgi:hypothetical protein
MERIRRSWELLKASWSVVRADKELVAYPIFSAIAGIVAAVLFVGAWLVTDGLDRAEGETLGLLDVVILFVFYLVGSAIVIFFNAALIAAANIRLEGGDPSLGDGFRVALSRLPAIIAWAAITATVGLVLRAIAERGGAIGTVVSIIGGMAWGLVTFLVVPVLVVEGVGPVEALKRSAGLLRTTWGEQIVGNFSIGLILGLAFLAVAVVGGVLVAVLAGVATVLGVGAAVLLVAALIVIALVGTALSGVFNIALYRYAVGKDTGGYFPQSTLAGAFRSR